MPRSEPDISALVPGFLDEVADRLATMVCDLDRLSTTADPAPVIGHIVAALHTIKGSASCLSLLNLAEVAHRAESIADRWRSGECQPDARQIAALRHAVDDVRSLSDNLALGAAPTRSPDEATDRLHLCDILEHHAALAYARARESRRAISVEISTQGDPVVDQDVARHLCPVLLHTLNNCVDHATQDPATRRRAGKPPVTSIRLTAAVQPNADLALTIADDGPGLDRRAIARRAVALGYPATDPARLDDHALQQMIFHPGLSTTECPSIRAGRGVGLEAVHLAVSDLGGSVRVLSTPGRGTTVTFLIPVLNRPAGNTDTGSESADAA